MRHQQVELGLTDEQLDAAPEHGVTPAGTLVAVVEVRVVDEVDRRFSLVRETGEQVEANFKRAERLRQAILVNSFVTNNKGLSYNSG